MENGGGARVELEAGPRVEAASTVQVRDEGWLPGGRSRLPAEVICDYQRTSVLFGVRKKVKEKAELSCFGKREDSDVVNKMRKTRKRALGCVYLTPLFTSHGCRLLV